jgi:hypothetical protein
MCMYSLLYKYYVFRYLGEAADSPPFKVQYGSNVGGRPQAQFASEGDGVKDMYVTGRNTPLGARKILSVEEQYDRLKDGTLD